MMRIGAAVAAFACVLLTSCAAVRRAVPPIAPALAVGEVSATSAVLWARCAGGMRAEVAVDDARPVAAPVAAEHDFVTKIAVGALATDSRHHYRAWCDGQREHAAEGTFRTAPDPHDPAPVRFVWGGDVGGQNVCRDAALGYDVFDRLRARDPDFFVALGDLIYADDACLATGRHGNRQIPGPPPAAGTVDAFRAHWRYNRADPALARFLRATSYYAVWDDHETSNDAGPLEDVLPARPDEHRLPLARAAFLDYQPLIAADRLYRSARWGKHLEVFILDTRSHRAPDRTLDVGPEPKSLLGAEQRDWLIDGLAASNATWKVVVSSVPMAIPTGGDGWADGGTRVGFERELLAILRRARDAHLRNLVFLTTDVHFATGFRHRPFPGLEVLELVSGPLSAGIFARRDVDPTLHPERLFFHDPETVVGTTPFERAHGYFNFGEIAIERDGALTASIIDAKGTTVFTQRWAFDP